MKFARVFVIACALVYIAQVVELSGWDSEMLIVITIVAVPLALAWSAPRFCMRGSDAAQRHEVNVAWWRRMPWLFVPLALPAALLWSFYEIRWRPPNQSPDEFQSTTMTLVNLHLGAYFLVVVVGAFAFLKPRGGVPSCASNGPLFAIAVAIVAFTSFAGFGVMAILGLAVT